MSVNSQASAMLNALASPGRLALLCTVAERQAAGADCSLGAIAGALDIPMKVNAALNQVHDDHAYLRRMLVDFGQLTRDGSADYRRAG
jgi:uncharacterized protein DUF2087